MGEPSRERPSWVSWAGTSREALGGHCRDLLTQVIPSAPLIAAALALHTHRLAQVLPGIQGGQGSREQDVEWTEVRREQQGRGRSPGWELNRMLTMTGSVLSSLNTWYPVLPSKSLDEVVLLAPRAP